ncbi:MAG: tetratricopeptide repeat protein, partial [Chloroflexota bacterium]|nr:tetratricopeptide repeat protein [Chloroflexota bacterium]
IIVAWIELGQVAYLQRDYQQAVACWKEGLTIAQATNMKYRVARLLAYLGHATLAQGDLPRALDFFGESLKLYIEISNNLAIARGLVAFGGVAIVQGQDEVAARLFGSAEALAEKAGEPLWRRDSQNPYERIVIFERDLYDRNLAALRAKLDQVVLAKWWAEGRTLTLEQVVVEAERLTVMRPSPPHAAVAVQYPLGLTTREVEVLGLLARGLSNQQIADQLVLSKRTVHAHLRSIYGKLDVTTRGAATRAVLERKIV